MDGIGAKLRSARLAWKLTLREVADRSFRLAQQWGNPAYRISASWLDRIENKNRGLSAAKLIVLANIYSLTPEKMLDLCPPTDSPAALDEPFSMPNGSLLVQGQLEDHAKLWLPDSLIADVPPEDTSLMPAAGSESPARYIRGIIGRQDRTMDPMIPPGSLVLIDTHRNAIAGRREWTHEFDRPIYFLLTRTGYLCGFCELDKSSEWLTLMPHALSFERSRRWRFPNEVDVVGTVAAVTSLRLL